MKLRIMRPAPASRTTASAISTTTRMPGEIFAASAPAGTSAAVLERGVDVEFREAQGGGETEQESGADGDRAEVEERANVHGEVERLGLAKGTNHVVEGADAPEGERPSNGAAGDGEHQAFDEELADDSPASGAEGDADGDFAHTADGASELQIRDIGAGDEEHESDGAEHSDKDDP